ncbi:MAG: YhdP family protein [Gammaproteobacteria bacterium]
MLRRALSVIWYLGATLVVLAALTLSLARLALPLLEARAGQLEALVSAAVEHPARIGRLELAWRGLGPELRVHALTLSDPVSGQALLTARELRISLGVLDSLRAWRPVPARVVLLGSELSLHRDAEGRLAVQGIQVQLPRANPWLLVLAQPLVELRDIRVHWRDDLARIPDFTVEDIDLRLRNRGTRHQLQLDLDLPAEFGAHLQIAADLSGRAERPFDWSGAVHLAVEGLPLPRWLTPRLPPGWQVEGTLDAAVWTRMAAGVPQRVQGTLSVDRPRLIDGAGQSPVFEAERLATRLDWRQADDAWTLHLAQLQLMPLEGDAWPETGASLRVEPDRGGLRQMQVELDYLRIEALLPLVPRLPGLTAEQRALLDAAQPGGELRDLRLAFGVQAGQARALSAQLRFQDLHSRPAAPWPGLTGLSGQLLAAPAQGSLALDSRAVQVEAPALFPAPLMLDQLAGRVDWRRLDDRWRIETARLVADNADFHTRSRLRLELLDDGSSPLLDAQTDFSDGQLQTLTHYLPRGVMSPRVVGWLERALVSGAIPAGALLYQGRLGDFPFDQATGRLEVRLGVRDAVIDYHPDWHRIEGLEAELAFINRGLQIRGVTGRILGSEIRDVELRIDDLAHARLALQGNVAGPLADMLRYLHDSPLGGTGAAAVLGGVEATGPATLGIGLRLPLTGPRPRVAEVDGRLSLAGNHLRLPDWEVALEDLGGVLNFTHNSLRSEALRGQLFGVPVELAVSDARLGSRPATRVRVSGRLPVVQRLRAAGVALAARLAGSSAWIATLDLPRESPGAQPGAPAQLALSSDLRGLAVDLPEPFGKLAAAAADLSWRAELRPGGLGPMQLVYAGHSAAFALAPGADGPALERAELKLGSTDARLPEAPGLHVSGRLPSFAWEAWRGLLGGAGAGAGVGTGLARLDLEIGALEALGRGFREVRIQAQRPAERWQVRLGGPDLDGTLELPAQPDQPWVLRFARLHIPAGGAGEGAPAALDPAGVPPLDLAVEQLRLHDLDLGRVTLTTHPLSDGLAVDALDLTADWLRLSAHGEWTRRAGRDASRFRIALHGGELGELLGRFGYAGNVEGGETQGEIDANWPGTPADFALARLEGELAFRVGKGRLPKVEAGAGRAFGLFNLQGLRRRLALDFSDLFEKGFGFDRIDGKFTLLDGDAYTNDLTVDGPAARIEISGRTGLARQDYDQLVTVIPHVQSTLPLAGALAGGPVVGAALLLADKLFARQLEGLTRFARYQYTVTGDWDAPQVTQLSPESARGARPEPSPTAPPGAEQRQD